jgi:uncharacterized protein (DUF433 family)
MTNPEVLRHITLRPEVFGGKPIIRNSRISVELAFDGLIEMPYS